jgi:cobalt-zinc-cadmium efflux system outer membrane protein
MKRIVVVSMLVVAACASVDRTQGHAEIARALKERTGLERSPDVPELVRQKVESLLVGELTLEHAVELALLNNRRLAAVYEGFGVAQADLVQAGLIHNPSLSAWVGVPANQPAGLNLTFGLVQSFVDLALRPLKKSVAQEQFAQAELRVVDAALDLHHQVRAAYVTLQSSQQALALHQAVLEAAQASAELSQRQSEAGNIGALRQSTTQAMYEQLKLEVEHDQLEVVEDRERLNRLLGLQGAQLNWSLSAPLPQVPTESVHFDNLEDSALARRPDLEVARRELELLTHALRLAKTERVAGIFSLGVTAERKHDGLLLVGPTLEFELPIFDQRQAMIARIEAQQRQAEAIAQALAIETRSEVRAGEAKLLQAQRVAEQYRVTLLPLQARIVELSQLHYNAMLMSVFELLATRQAELSAQRAYLRAVRDYWVAQFELERKTGGQLKVTR